MNGVSGAISGAPLYVPPGPEWIAMSEVEPQDVEFLAYPRIPLKFTLLEGDPGTFKSFIGLSLTASVTTGGESHSTIPGFVPQTPAAALYLTAEDGLSDTVRKRLDMLGADVARVHVLKPFTPYDLLLNDEGFTQLRLALEKFHPRLVVIDPLVGYTDSKVDIYRTNEVRAITKKLAALADEYRLAMLAIRHLTKDSKAKAIYRGNSSIDFTAAARSVLLAGLDPATDTHALVHIKASVTAKALALSYSYDHDNGGFKWGEECAITSGDLFGNDTTEGRSKLEEARDWLIAQLSKGPVPQQTIKTKAVEAGLSWATVKRARPLAKVQSRPVGNQQGGRGAARFELYLDSVAHPKPPGGQNQSYQAFTGSSSEGVHVEPVNAQSAVATGDEEDSLVMRIDEGG